MNPVWIVIVHSPVSGRVSVAVYFPASLPGVAGAVTVDPRPTASRLGCSPDKGRSPCCRTVNVRAVGCRATKYSGRSSTVAAAQPPTSRRGRTARRSFARTSGSGECGDEMAGKKRRFGRLVKGGERSRQLGQPAFQEASLRALRRQLQCMPIGRRRLALAVQAAQQLTSGRVGELVVSQVAADQDRVDQGQTLF